MQKMLAGGSAEDERRQDSQNRSPLSRLGAHSVLPEKSNPTPPLLALNDLTSPKYGAKKVKEKQSNKTTKNPTELYGQERGNTRQTRRRRRRREKAQMAERCSRAGRRRAQLGFPLRASGTRGNGKGSLERTWGRNRPRTDERWMFAVLILGFHPRV